PPPISRTSTLSLHDALPISGYILKAGESNHVRATRLWVDRGGAREYSSAVCPGQARIRVTGGRPAASAKNQRTLGKDLASERYSDRKSTRLNSSHLGISYAV